MKGPLDCESGKDRDDEFFFDSARKNDLQVRTRTRMVLWAEHFKSPVAAPARASECLEAVGFADYLSESHTSLVCVSFFSDGGQFGRSNEIDDFVSCGSAAALDEVDRVLTAHFDTKILPRIGPTAYGGEVTEGKHLGRTIRWSPQGFEWESNSKHVEDILELWNQREHRRRSRRRREGRRDIDDTLNATDAQTFRQAAGTGLSIVRHTSLRCPW